MLTSWLEGGGAYDRADHLLRWRLSDGPTVRVEFKAWARGADIALLAAQYRLLVDGAARAFVTVAPGQKIAAFILPLADVLEGWCSIEIEAVAGSAETFVPAFSYMQRGAAAAPPDNLMPVLEGTYENKGTPAEILWAWVPSRWQPTTAPYPWAERPGFSTTVGRDKLIETDIAAVIPPPVIARLTLSAEALPSTDPAALYVRSSQLPDTTPLANVSVARRSILDDALAQRMAIPSPSAPWPV